MRQLAIWIKKINRRYIKLGFLHLCVGIAILLIRYVGGEDAINWLASLAAGLPPWTIVLVSFVKAIYGLGSYLPGTTIILLNLIAQTCSPRIALTWALSVWVGVVFGLFGSYCLGRIFGSDGPIRAIKWQDLAFVIHPNLASLHFFERGYFNQSWVVPMFAFAALGLLFLIIVAIFGCSFSEFARKETGDAGALWGVLLAAWGISRIIMGLSGRRSIRRSTPNGRGPLSA